jgi:aspartyl aminopeptidase
VATRAAALRQAGSREIRTEDPWPLQPGSMYHFSISQRSLVAFRTPVQPPRNFRIIGAHTDSPCLHLREGSTQWAQDLLVCGTDAYGSIIRSSWLDRPLVIAGTVAYRDPDDGVRTALVEFGELKATIPNLALHLNREVNKGYEYNQNTQMRAFFSARIPTEQRHMPWEWLCRDALRQSGLRVNQLQDILAMDLYLSDAQPAVALDPLASLVSASRIDNLAGCQSCLDAFIGTKVAADALQMACFFDHEEIGSRSLQGADSILLPQTLRRIWDNLHPGGMAGDAWYQALARSGLISVDVAHAQHPNWPELHDPAYAPRLNQGIVIKQSVNHRYASQTCGAGRLLDLCRSRTIPVQRYSVRADLAAGSTIGPTSSAATGIPAIDIGIPILAMHSIRETAGMGDQCAMVSALAAFLEEF